MWKESFLNITEKKKFLLQLKKNFFWITFLKIGAFSSGLKFIFWLTSWKTYFLNIILKSIVFVFYIPHLGGGAENFLSAIQVVLSSSCAAYPSRQT